MTETRTTTQPQWYAPRTDRPLRHHLAACQALRLRSGCAVCAEACPLAALQFKPALQIEDACVSCGRCVPVCPMGALGMRDLPPSADATLAPQSAAAQVDCQRVPAKQRAALSVPCLGALSVADLLNWQRQYPQGVQLLDRGWCADCPVGGEVHPAQSALTQAQHWLTFYAIPVAQQVRLELRALPAQHAVPFDVTPPPQHALSRRAFFRQLAATTPDLLREPQSAAPIMPLGTAPDSHPSLARQRLLVALSKLTEQPRQGLPAAVFPQLSVNADCCDHQVCVRMCPTAALQSYSEQGVGGHQFFTFNCIECGLCSQYCPQQALYVQPRSAEAWTAPTRQGEVLTRHSIKQCQQCGASYSVTAGQRDWGCCDPCHKSRELARGAFQQLFGANSQTNL